MEGTRLPNIPHELAELIIEKLTLILETASSLYEKAIIETKEMPEVLHVQNVNLKVVQQDCSIYVLFHVISISESIMNTSECQ